MAPQYTLGIKPAVVPYSYHDPSAAIFKDGELVFAVEEERYTRNKHAPGAFPTNAIESCLDYEDISLSEVNKVVLPQDKELIRKRLRYDIQRGLTYGDTKLQNVRAVLRYLKQHIESRFFTNRKVKSHLKDIDPEIPPLKNYPHHKLHAASAFHPTEFNEAIVITIDGSGEYDSTVIWRANDSGLNRIRTYEIPNSFGYLYGTITEYLGYRANNGEGKVMGLAPYGEYNTEIERKFRDVMEFGVDYDVTYLTSSERKEDDVQKVEDLLGHPRNETKGEFDEFYQDVAYTIQNLLEESVVSIAEYYISEQDINNVCLAGGVALNCKMNKQIMELESVDEVFIQPVANDAGLALGAGWLESDPSEVKPMTDVYFGPSISQDNVKEMLNENKIEFEEKDDTERYIAGRIADGALVGWVQGRMEMGPRALGNRSILADPRTSESRDRVNRYVKHREEWRPFAPSMTEEAADQYLMNCESSPYMIKTFNTKEEYREDIQAVIHKSDKTTRPQTVTKEQNPKYYKLIKEFEDLTGVPVVLNTSFNDHGEPIILKASEAITDFYNMGLDILVIDDMIIEK